MSSIFDKMPQKKRYGNNSAPQSINLPLQIDQVHVANPKGPTPATDHAEATLLVPAFGLEAGSTVKLRMQPRAPASAKDKEPMEIWHLQKGKKKGSGGAAGETPVIIAENAVMQSDGSVACGWLKIAVHESTPTPDSEWLHVGQMVTVNYLNKPQGKGAYQTRDVHWTSDALPITSDGNGDSMSFFRDLVVNMLADHPELASGRPMVAIRLVNNEGLHSGEAADNYVQTSLIARRWIADSKTYETPEDAVERWLGDADTIERWTGFIEQADAVAAEGGTIEVWPVWRYSTGLKTVERQLEREEQGKLSQLDHLHFSAPRLDYNGEIVVENGRQKYDYGLITTGSIQVVRPQGWEEFVANQTWTHERFPAKLFTTEEVVTQNLPEATAKLFNERAEKRVALAREARIERNKAAEAEASEEQGQDFDGAPDPTAGMGFGGRR